MAPIVRTANAIALCYPTRAKIFNAVSAQRLEAGLLATEDANGRAALAAADDAIRGLSLQTIGPGSGVSLLRAGHVYGYDVDALAYGAPVYAGADGELDTAGTVPVGRIEALADDPDLTKVVYIQVDEVQEVGGA